MKAKRSKRVLLSILSLSLAAMITTANAQASEKPADEAVNKEQTIPESAKGIVTDEDIAVGEDTPLVDEPAIPVETVIRETDDLLKDLIVKDVDWNSIDVNDVEIYTYPIPVNTPSNSVVGYIKLETEERGTYGLIELTGDMLSGFDSSEVGSREYNIPIGVWTRTVTLEVGENTDINDVGKIAETTIAVGFDSAKLKNVILEGDTTIEFGHISMLDNVGSTVCTAKFVIKENVPRFDTSTLGKHTYTMNFKNHPITFDVNIRPVAFSVVDLNNRENSWISIPIGGDLKKANVWVEEYDAENGSPYGAGPGLFYSKIIGKQIDTTKAGTQEITLTLKDSRGRLQTGTVKLRVGMPEQGTVEKLLPSQAQATIPSGKVISVWDVPSGEAGAGTWSFQTDLSEGTEVVVWSFHNNKWLKIGVYKVGMDGVVTVTFTADQLSPVLLTLNSNSGGNSNNSSTGSNSSGNSNTSSTGNNSGVTTPKTGDTASTMALSIGALLSLFILCVLVCVKRKKSLIK